MRRLALLLAAGTLWLFLAAIPAFADGGPHVASINSGSTSLTADGCAGCHRAHTAQGEGLLVEATQEALCLSCHNATATGSAVDVMTGVQYVKGTIDIPTKADDPVLGYLRDGGYQQAHIGSTDGQGTRVGYYRALDTVSFRMKVPADSTAQAVTSAHIASLDGTGGVQAKQTMWGNGLSNALEPIVDLECTGCHNPHGNGQYRILNAFKAGDSTVSTAVSISAARGATDRFFTSEAHSLVVGDIVTISGVTGLTPDFSTAAQYIVKSIAGNTFAVAAAPTKTTADITGAVINFTGDFNGTGSVQRWASIVDDAPLPSGTDTRNYTIIQTKGTQGTNSTYMLYESNVLAARLANSFNSIAGNYSETAGDYFHRTVPWNPAVNEAGCNTANPIPANTCVTANDAPNGRPATVTTTGAGAVAFNDQISAWCATCHTRYYSSTNTNPGIFDGNPAELEPASSAQVAKTIASASGDDILSPAGSANSFGYAVGDIVTFSAAAPGNQSYVVYYATTGSGAAQTSTIRVSATLDGAPITAPAATGTVIRLYPFSASSWYFPRNGGDTTYKFQHQTTTNRACTTCHVGHGSDAQMLTTGLTTFSADLDYPDGTAHTVGYNSRLLKIDNRGTCQACHDPTGTATAGTQLGNPAAPTVP